MKKIAVILFIFNVFVQWSEAQPRAIGGRLGNYFEVSYQHAVTEKSMAALEVGASFHSNIEAALVYNWVFPITTWQNKGAFNWYAGTGIIGGWGETAVGRVVSENGISYRNDLQPRAFVAGAVCIGVEYQFWFPLQLSVDYRPAAGIGFGDYYTAKTGKSSGFYPGFSSFALSVRYLFHVSDKKETEQNRE
ncbi:MAG: hypothetical protein LBS16_04165 [Prevotellaceae bacterium]|nr:hypothetical protein [Prevotellaceae bacterium]